MSTVHSNPQNPMAQNPLDPILNISNMNYNLEQKDQYRSLLSHSPSKLKDRIFKSVDEQYRNSIRSVETNPRFGSYHNIFDKYLIRYGLGNLVRENVSFHRNEVSRQQFYAYIDTLCHTDLCKFIVNELSGRLSEYNFIS